MEKVAPKSALSNPVTRIAIRQAPRQGFRTNTSSRAPPYARMRRSWELERELGAGSCKSKLEAEKKLLTSTLPYGII